MLRQNGVVNPLFKQSILFVAAMKVPIVSLNAIVINSLLLTKEFEAFSKLFFFGVHAENGSFSKLSVLNSCDFFSIFEKLCFDIRAMGTQDKNVEVLLRFHMKTEQCERDLTYYFATQACKGSITYNLTGGAVADNR